MQLIRYLLSNFYLNMFRVSLCPSSGEQECALPRMVFCTGRVGCGCVELGRELCALTLGINCIKTSYWMGSLWPVISLWMGETSLCLEGRCECVD